VKKWLTIVLAVSLLMSCSLDWLTGEGHYGPFELVIKAKDGAHVEDIIVRLTKIVPSGESLGHTYNAYVVMSTDVPVMFPRGFVTNDTADTISMDVSVSHPTYVPIPKGATFVRQTEGKIDLGEQIIVPGAKYENAESQMYALLLSGYFWQATDAGREDLIRKYFVPLLERIFVEKGITNDVYAQRELKEKYLSQLPKSARAKLQL